MSYSNSITTWTAGTVSAGQKRGWMGQIWTAINTTTQMPAGDSPDWSNDVPEMVTGLTFVFEPDNRQYLQTKVAGFTIMNTHINRAPEVYCSGLTILRNVKQPYLITFSHIK